MPEIETILSEYWDQLIGQSRPVDVDAVISGRSTVVVLDPEGGPHEADQQADAQRGVELMADYLRQRPGESAPTPARSGRSGVVAAVAAAILVVAGVLVVADGSGDRSVTDPASSPPEAGPVSSPDPGSLQWSRVPHDEGIFGGSVSKTMSSVTAGGPGLVAVGSVGRNQNSNAAVWTSVDGLTWSRVPHDETVFGGPGGQRMSDVTVGGPGLVAVGWAEVGGYSDAAVWTSVDGLNWSRVPHDEAIFGTTIDQEMNAVTTGGPGLVAVGWASDDQNDESAVAAVWTSVDGTAWSQVPHDETVFGGGQWQWMSDVTTGGPGLVAVGEDGSDAAVWISVDGLTWSRVPHDEEIFGRADGRGGQEMSKVVATTAGLVAVGSEQIGDDVPTGQARNAAAWTSVDGLTWSRVPHDASVFGGIGNEWINDVTATETGLVAVGVLVHGNSSDWFTDQEAVVWTSPDGLTWSRAPQDEAAFGEAAMRSVTAVGTRVVAVGDESLAPVGKASDSLHVWVADPSQ